MTDVQIQLQTDPDIGKYVNVETSRKYAKIERERRFLLHQFPTEATVIGIRRVTDRYIEDARLRLRHQVDADGLTTFKLTQKIPSRADEAQQGFLTTMYLSAEEFRVFAELPSKQLRKTRYSVPPFGIDVFKGSLEGMILAEAEFESASEAASLKIPPFIVREVSDDARFTGGRLAQALRHEIQEWLAEYGIGFSAHQVDGQPEVASRFLHDLRAIDTWVLERHRSPVTVQGLVSELRADGRYGSYEDRIPNQAALSASLKLVNAVRKIKFS